MCDDPKISSRTVRETFCTSVLAIAVEAKSRTTDASRAYRNKVLRQIEMNGESYRFRESMKSKYDKIAKPAKAMAKANPHKSKTGEQRAEQVRLKL